MASKFVGIDLGSREVRVAVVTGGVRGVRLVDRFSVPVGEADEGVDRLDAAVAEAVAALRERGLGYLPVGVALPGTATSFRVVKFPFSDPKRVAQVISFEIDGQFPMATEDLEYDHSVSALAGGGSAALVAAARSDRVDAIGEVFRDAGIDLRVITSGPMAVAQVLGGAIKPAPADAGEGEGETKPVALLVDLGHRETGIVAMGDKGPVAARTLRRGGRDQTQALREAYGLGEAEAEQAKHRDGFVLHDGLRGLTAEQSASGEVLAKALERTIRELEHTRRWLHSEFRCEVTELRLVGGAANVAGLELFLKERLGLPCSLWRGQGSHAIRGVAPEVWAEYAVALGTALGVAKRPLMQLYEPVAGGREGGWVQERFGTIAALGIAITAFAAVDTIVKLKGLEAEQSRYETELEDATREVFGHVLYSASDVEQRLAAVEGPDLTSMIPERGAMDVVALIATAATPSSGAEGAADDLLEPGETTDGVLTPTSPPGLVFPTGPPVVPGAEGALMVELAPVAADAGIVFDDDLVFSRLDVRELVLDIQLSATRATAQDRFKAKLMEVDCITDVQTGKIRDQNNRKVFNLKADHRCFRGEKEE